MRKTGRTGRSLSFLFFFGAVLAGPAPGAGAAGELPPLVPKPLKIERGRGRFLLGPGTGIYFQEGSAEAARAAKWLAWFLSRGAGLRLRVEAWSGKGTPSFGVLFTRRGAKAELGREGYVLEVRPASVVIRSAGGAGLFYGAQTLRQLLPPRVEADHQVKGAPLLAPCLRIEDKPRFKWRGMHLDVSRHFFPPGQIKEYIDYLAMLKLNVFHWHLVDDGGWRIEIKKYPRLTSIGAWRLGDGRGWSYRHITFPEKKTGQRVYGGYYTQKEIRDIVRYAKERYVTIVPEIEMPGHSLPALVAYPELGIDLPPAQKKKVLARFGGWENVYNAGLEKTYTFLQNVLKEVMELFPSKYIHIGGDEVGKGYWSVSPAVKALMKREHLKDLNQVQSYFIHRMDDFLTSHGRRLVGWDEILQGGLSPHATVMSWRGIGGGIKAARMNHDVVMTPTGPCYFDYSYRANSPKRVYLYDPVPAVLTAAQARHVLGVQANVWTEWMNDFRRVQYMIFPRIFSLAETAWVPREGKDWARFRDRLYRLFPRMDRMVVNYYLPAPESDYSAVFLGKGPAQVVFHVPPGREGTLRYTLNGETPTMDSKVYRRPIRVTRPCLVKAAFFRPDGSPGDVAVVSVVRASSKKDTRGLKPGLVVSYAEGSWDKTPDFGKVKILFSKVTSRVDLSARKRNHDYALRFSGFLKIPRTGVYTFTLGSDDGSVLSLGGAVILDHDGLHPYGRKKGSLELRAGLYPLELKYFQGGGAQKLTLTVKGPGIPKGPIPPELLFH